LNEKARINSPSDAKSALDSNPYMTSQVVYSRKFEFPQARQAKESSLPSNLPMINPEVPFTKQEHARL